jgi:hydroxylamine reductase
MVRKEKMMSMFCRQCEQTAGGKACTVRGVCGKDEDVAGLQDLLIHVLNRIAVRVQNGGKRSEDMDRFVQEALFMTVTNVNFDAARIEEYIKKAYGYAQALGCECVTPDGAEMRAKAKGYGRNAGDTPEDVRSLRELVLYGIKGVAAYADHARILGQTDETVNAFFYKALAALEDDTLSADELTALVLETGMVNLKTMELLDAGNTGTYGHPEPTKVTVGYKKGPAIIVTGHDLKDLKELLEQTAGIGVNVYTHGEMLPCLAYPELKKYSNLAGHYGTAWQNQQKEFDGIPAAILFTTNCIQKPLDSYKDNVFTTGIVGWPGIKHIGGTGRKDFTPVIEKAKQLGGFGEDRVQGTTMTGFARNTVMSVAPAVIDGVKAGKIRHFFLVGGCDGAKPGRNYYTEFVQKAPQDTVILTLACGKFRFNTLELGEIGGIPRLLDVGQCNDAYSAIQIAVALAKAFECEVNDLPLSLVLSWYEQKAVCILLTLLALGIKNIRLGPSLPAFVSPGVLNVLIEKFAIAPISTPGEDLAQILG